MGSTKYSSENDRTSKEGNKACERNFVLVEDNNLVSEVKEKNSRKLFAI